MDATRSSPDVGTEIPNGSVYPTGGCLCDHPVQDYDILVESACTSGDVIRLVHGWYKDGYFKTVSITHAYEEQTDKRYHTIAVLTTENYKIDLLFMQPNMDVYKVMLEYPLSIQRQVLINDTLVQGLGYSSAPIYVYFHGKFEDKYKKYYPDKEFKYIGADTKDS